MPDSGNPRYSSHALYLRLLRHVRPYWRVFSLALFSLLVVSATEPAVPALMKPLLDRGFSQEDIDRPWLLPMLLVGLYLIRGVAGYIGNVSITWVAYKVIMDLREAMFERLLHLPAAFYDTHPAGSLISKLSYDAAQVSEASTTVVTTLVKDSLAVLGLVAYMVYVSWKLALVLIVLGPVIGFIVYKVSDRLRRMSRKLQESMGSITHVAEEGIAGHKVIKVYGAQEYERARFHEAANRARRYGMKFIMAGAVNTPLVALVIASGLAVVIYVAIGQSQQDAITMGGFVSFLAAMGMLLPALKRLTSVNQHLQRGLAAAESVFALIDEAQEPDRGVREVGRLAGEIQLCDVGMTYPHSERPALVAVDLRVEPGETVALVGASGSGKTTLVNLIPRFYHPDRGRILIDGIDIEAIRVDGLRDNIALVSQEVVLFNDSVRNNIAYGCLRRHRQAEIIAAAEAAHAMEFIERLPEGLESRIGDHGARLSGGQRQRLAIARALLKDAPILIMDEATSSLDSASERHIQAALEALRRGRTCIIIAHRLSTVENADRIVVMEQGRIVESGTHRQLLEQQGIYTRLYRTQFALPDG